MRWLIVTALVALGACSSDPDPDPPSGECSEPQTPRACLAAQGCDWDGSCAPETQAIPPALGGLYEGEATTDAGPVPVSFKFLEPGVRSRGLFMVGDLGYGVDARVSPAGALLLDTSDARCEACSAPAVILDGRLTATELIIDTVAARDGNAALPFIDLRAVPHDGVKPAVTPVFDIDFDPAPVAGLYVGDVFALSDGGVVDTTCGLHITGDPLTAPVFQCGLLSGADEASVVWDESRSLLNVLVGPAERRYLLVGELGETDGAVTLAGVIADQAVSPNAVSPDEIGFEALVGTFSFGETGN